VRRSFLISATGIALAVGITMAQSADAGTIKLTEWGTASVTDGQTNYTLQANENTPFASEYDINNTDGGPDFWVDPSNLARTPSATVYPAYPSLYVGLHWPNDPADPAPADNPSVGNPLQTGGLPTAAYNESVAAGDGGYGWYVTPAGLEDSTYLLTSFDTSHSTVASGSMYDTSYDIWFNSSEVGNQDSGTAPSWYKAPSDDPGDTVIPGTDLEMMIWLNDAGGMTPEGGTPVTTATVDGATYEVYYSNHNSYSRTITFLAKTQVSDLDDTAIGDFANAAVSFSSKYPSDPTLTSSWYLYDVEAGFEIYKGGGPSTGSKGLTGTFSYLQCPASGCG
jgi:hypothetical protein